jgi:uncharacterized protein YjiS (DUF1127 family)
MEMIMSTSSSTAEHVGNALGGAMTMVAAAAKRLSVAYVTWRVEQAAIILLRSMSDRELKDMGLGRSEIVVAVRGKSGTRSRLR